MAEHDGMIRKLFIVARTHPAVYGQLRRTVGREAGVEIIYDRRPTLRNPGRLRRLLSRLRRLRSVGSEKILATLDRRQRRRIDDELRTKGWAVVHIDPPRSGALSSSSSGPAQHRPAGDVAGEHSATPSEVMPRAREEDPPPSVARTLKQE